MPENSRRSSSAGITEKKKNLARDTARKMEHFILGKLNVSIKNDRDAII